MASPFHFIDGRQTLKTHARIFAFSLALALVLGLNLKRQQQQLHVLSCLGYCGFLFIYC